jgi:hypothetical protein
LDSANLSSGNLELEADMLRALAMMASVSVLLLAAPAAAECYPHCDYIQDYGPYDYTYVRPGLFGYPVCDRLGNCSPWALYAYSWGPRGRITVRSLRRQ